MNIISLSSTLKLVQARSRYLERSTQIGGELAEIDREVAAEAERERELRERMARVEQSIARARGELETLKGTHVDAEVALATQRRGLQAAERAVQDAVFGVRECESKIAETDNAVKVIDQQIERAMTEIEQLTRELAEDPVPPVRF